MRILIVNTFYYPNMVGGTEQSVKLLAESLANQGNEVFILSADEGNESREIINGVSIIRFNLKDMDRSLFAKVRKKILELNNLRIEEDINNIIDEIKPDIIHTNNLYYLSPIVWKCANKKNVRVVHTLRDYWGVCPRSTLLKKNGQICSKKNFICKHHEEKFKSFSKYVDYVTAPSKFTLDTYINSGFFTNAVPKVIYNAIDFNLEETNRIKDIKLDRDSKEINFLFIGMLEQHKGVKTLIDTFMSIDNENIVLNICGNGDLKDYVIENSKNDRRLKYLGTVKGDTKEDVFMKCDVMIVPSIWYEPFGRVVIEGYKYAMPVIGHDLGGISELLSDDVAIRVNHENSEELKNAIIKLSERETIKKYINNTPDKIAFYNLEEQLKHFNDLYTH